MVVYGLSKEKTMNTTLSIEEQARIRNLVNRAVHSRAKPGHKLPGYITFYGRDDSSPTGVLSIGGCPLTDEYESFIRSINSAICPLSPTER